MNYLLGVDIGGSTADFLLTTLEGKEISEFSTESANMGASPIEVTEGALRLGFQRLALDIALSDIGRVCLGIAGLHSGNRERLTLQLKQALPSHLSGGAIVVNDAVIGFHSSTQSETGIALIAGTGSLCSRISGERILKTAGGAGAKFSDRGSGYWIGKKTIQFLLESIDLGSPEQILLSEFGIEARNLESAKWQFTEKVNGFSQKDVASLSKLTAKLSNDHNWAQEIISSAAKHLAALVIGLKPRDEEVVLIGSLLNKNQRIQELVRRELEGLSLVLVQAPNPVAGAIAILQSQLAK